MKKHFLILLLLSHLNLFSQNYTEYKGNIELVTVYYNGAIVTENIKLNMFSDEMFVSIIHLPVSMDPNRLTFTLPDNCSILAMSHNLSTTNDYINLPEFKKMTDSISAIQQSQKLNDYKILALNTELELLKKNTYIGGTNTGVNISELQKAGDYYRLRQDDIYSKLVLLELNKQNYINQINDINSRKDAKISKKMILSREVRLHLKSFTTGIANLKLHYFCNNAAWKPIYDIKVKEIGQPLTLFHKGKIMNKTGKDWNNIQLTLSTADPSMNIIRPELEVWELDYNKNSYSLSKKMKDYKREDMLQNTSGVFKGNVYQEQEKVNEVRVNEVSNDFIIGEKATILSSNNTNTIDIKNYNLNAVYEYISIPSMDLIPFLVAKTTEWSSLPLSDGDANIYIGNNFIGQSKINLSETSDTMEISLGKNKKVTVDKRKKVDLTKKSWLGNQITETFTYEIALKNNNNSDIVLELWDQIPVSKHEDIVVSLIEISGAVLDEKTGKLTWRNTLKPGEEKKFIITFSVKYPKEKKVEVARYRSLRCPDF